MKSFIVSDSADLTESLNMDLERFSTTTSILPDISSRTVETLAFITRFIAASVSALLKSRAKSCGVVAFIENVSVTLSLPS